MIKPTVIGEPAAGIMQRILIIDDDSAVRSLVADKLDYEGYEVWSASNGRSALQIINQRGLPHLALVDLHMPEMDGFKFCDIVQEYSDLPVIFLTAVDDEETIVRGLKYFAEDYVTKPFSPRELAARIARVLRRLGDFSYALEAKMKIDEFISIDLAHQEILSDEIILKMTPIENKILYILLRNSPRVVQYKFMIERIWPLEEISTDVLRVHIHRLRNKMKKLSKGKEYIITKAGTGYFFQAT